LNANLKKLIQSSINGAIIIASFSKKIVKTFSKIKLLKMEINKEIILKMIKLDDNNVKC
jgi:hypothetical protein